MTSRRGSIEHARPKKSSRRDTSRGQSAFASRAATVRQRRCHQMILLSDRPDAERDLLALIVTPRATSTLRPCDLDLIDNRAAQVSVIELARHDSSLLIVASIGARLAFLLLVPRASVAPVDGVFTPLAERFMVSGLFELWCSSV